MKVYNYILIYIFLIIFSSCRFANKNDYIFPENYNGWSAIVFDVDGGIEKKFVNGRVQYNIPENGILTCSFSRSKGILNDLYYQYYDGKLVQIDTTCTQTKKCIRGQIISNKYFGKGINDKHTIIYLNVSDNDYLVSENFRRYSDEVTEFLKTIKGID